MHFHLNYQCEPDRDSVEFVTWFYTHGQVDKLLAKARQSSIESEQKRAKKATHRGWLTRGTRHENCVISYDKSIIDALNVDMLH